MTAPVAPAAERAVRAPSRARVWAHRWSPTITSAALLGVGAIGIALSKGCPRSTNCPPVVEKAPAIDCHSFAQVRDVFPRLTEGGFHSLVQLKAPPEVIKELSADSTNADRIRAWTEIAPLVWQLPEGVSARDFAIKLVEGNFPADKFAMRPSPLNDLTGAPSDWQTSVSPIFPCLDVVELVVPSLRDVLPPVPVTQRTVTGTGRGGKGGTGGGTVTVTAPTYCSSLLQWGFTQPVVDACDLDCTAVKYPDPKMRGNCKLAYKTGDK
ncbi:MAG: hypothetical protein WC901_01915 [Candidatus Margulisiibacteriota bacterium]